MQDATQKYLLEVIRCQKLYPKISYVMLIQITGYKGLRVYDKINMLKLKCIIVDTFLTMSTIQNQTELGYGMLLILLYIKTSISFFF